VLFLDEAPEFAAGVLDALREPLESGSIVLARAGGSARYPARFRLVLAANPCPCGYSATPGADCRCAPMAQRRYLEKLSGPLLDRIDMQLTLRPLTRALLTGDFGRTTSAEARERVAAAAGRARDRLAGTPWTCNGDVPGHVLRRRWPPHRRGAAQIESRVTRGALSLRGADRVLRVAWTIADLGERDVPSASDVAQALMLRDAAGKEAA
jgi:magnesium chelatase family protein